MTTLQALMQQVGKLTIDEKRSLAQFLLEQAEKDSLAAQAKPNGTLVQPDMERVRERQWLKDNWQAYLGQWVCLEGDQLISHGTDGHAVFAQAKSAGIETPFLVRVQNPTLPQMGGW